MPVYCVRWCKYAQSYVKADSEQEALEKAGQGDDYNFEAFEDTYGSDVAGWIPEDAEEVIE
jgi:hypothetical protein